MKGTCDSCGFYGDIEEYSSHKRDGEHKKLCELCANTSAGNTIEYPQSYPCPEVMQQINFVANVLLASLNVKPVIPQEPDE